MTCTGLTTTKSIKQSDRDRVVTFVMESSAYVARRMLFEVCDILTPIDEHLEFVYNELYDWMELYTERFGGDIFHRLPSCRTNRDQLLRDISRLYTGIFARIDDMHNITTLRTLFTVTFYMMVKYKEQTIMCEDIAYYFRLISRRLESWDRFEQR